MIAFGNTEITKAYLGNTEVNKIYLGDELVFGGDSPTPVLPYDAQVEYLQSSGTQYIDTDVLFQIGLQIDIEAKINSNYSTTQVLLGPSASGGCWLGNVSYNSGSFGIGANANQVIGRSNSKTSMTLNYIQGSTTLVGNGITRSLSRGTNPTTTTIKLFSTGSGYYSYANIYSCVISHNSVILANFIPVRKDGIGYLYDKISGNLFGNSGTGSFTLGNDVTT